MRTKLLSLVAAHAAVILLSVPAPAQAGGFSPGELILHSPAIQGSGSSDGGIVRIDPFTGQTAMLLDLVQTHSSYDAIAYDPFRDRVIFYGGFTAIGQPQHLYALDGFGQVRDLGFTNRSLSGFAPAIEGSVYFRDHTASSTAPFRYIDANDVEHTLMDASGTQPFLMPTISFSVSAIEYDAPSNSLIVVSANGTGFACAGGDNVSINVHKLPLSADGSRVVGPVQCAQFLVNPSGGNHPVGLSRIPGGLFLISVDDNSNGAHPRQVRLDPATVSLTTFATTGSFLGAASGNAGTYSTLRGEAIMLDTGNNVLRAFAAGSSGNGTTITPSMQISSPGGSGEVAAMIEIPIGACGTNNVSLYCTAKTTASGCVPVITTAGGPSLSAPGGFVIRASQVDPNRPGLFFYGLNGSASIPFQGGFLCVQPPTRRTALQDSGGSGTCGGQFLFDFNAWLAGGNDPLIAAGTVVDGQFWFRDPPSASTTGLSAGIEFSLCQ